MSDGKPTGWNANSNGWVNVIAPSGSLVYTGGTFISMGDSVRHRIVALDASTGIATGWNPNASDMVTALAVSGQTVYAGGYFSNICNVSQPYFAAMDAAYDPTDVEETEAEGIPKEFTLSQNYPNPFNPITTIEFTLAKTGMASLKIFDILGREIATLVNEELKGGILYKKTFDASKLSSGIYFYRLQAGEKIMAKKLLLLK
jgi:hypothetical protein